MTNTLSPPFDGGDTVDATGARKCRDFFLTSVTTRILARWQPHNHSRLLNFLGYTLRIITYINFIYIFTYISMGPWVGTWLQWLVWCSNKWISRGSVTIILIICLRREIELSLGPFRVLYMSRYIFCTTTSRDNYYCWSEQISLWRVPARDGLFALILWYVAKTIYWS